MDSKNIRKFINFINSYEPSGKEPKELKIIFGIADYYGKIQNYDIPIEIYKLFGSVAFILNNRSNYISSESRVWNILLGDDNECSKKFLGTVKHFSKNQNGIINKLISYLYFEKGLLLLNRMNKENSLFEWFLKKKVTDVLFLGLRKYKSFSRYFPNARMGVIKHPSNKARATNIYNERNSNDIGIVSYRKKVFPKTTFEAFKVICLQE